MTGPAMVEPTPKKKNVVMTLAEQANAAMQAGADPERTTERLKMMVQHIQSTPQLLIEAEDALNNGADAGALGERIYHLSLSGKAQRDNATDKAALIDEQSGPQGAARAAFHGATMHFGDEITGAARAAFDPGDFKTAYATEVEGARADLHNFRESHPKTAIAADLMGGLAPAALPGVRALGMVKGGAAFGAAQGAGDADDGNRLAGAATGALAGGVTAGALKYGAAPVARMGFDFAKMGASKVAEDPTYRALSEWFEKHPPGLSAKQVGPMVPGSNPPPNSARGWMQDRIADIAPQSPEDRARSLVLEKLGADKAELPNLLTMAHGSTKPNALGDLAGENTLGLQRAAKTVPGEGKTEIPRRLYERQAGQQDRLVNDATSLAGTGGRTNIPKTIEAFGAARDAKAEEMFGQLRQSPPMNGVYVASILRTPSGMQAVKQAERILSDTPGGKFAPIFDVHGKARALTFDEVKAIKGAFDDLIGQSPVTPLQSGGLGKTGRAAVINLKNQFLNVADQHFPGYADARQAFAEPSAIMNALNDGKDFFSRGWSKDELSLTMEKMSDPEKRAFVQSGMEELASRIESGMKGYDRTRKFILPVEMQARIRLLFPDDQSFNQFIGRAEEEARMRHSLNFTMGGSNTVDKLAEVQDLAGGGNGWLDAMTSRGPIRGSIHAAANSALRHRAAGVTTETANALTPMFTAGMSGNPQELQDLIQALIAYQARSATRNTTRAAASRPITNAAASGASRFTQPNDRR